MAVVRKSYGRDYDMNNKPKYNFTEIKNALKDTSQCSTFKIMDSDSQFHKQKASVI